jgi:diguanylate cyclase (GGDEF)-like protein/PAS domain S-box-containing protein/putative nucleotidyltransferase with HDIG domain
MPFLSISLSWSYSAEKIINTGAAETRLALIGNLRTVVDEADVIQGIDQATEDNLIYLKSWKRKELMEKKNIPIKTIIILMFVILMITISALIGYIVYSNWSSSIKQFITIMVKDLNDEIYHQVETFIYVPEYINQVNKSFIEDGIVDLRNVVERESYFVGVLENHSSQSIYSFSYGTEQGEYYGARRNINNVIEIMRNDVSTNGHSWYYSVNEDKTAGERVVDAGKFDPRTRDWYKAAKKTGKAVFSPIYKHFVMNDLTVSVAMPIYNKERELQGVLGSHVTLSRINNYLQEIVLDKNAYALIVEKDTGYLVANSFEMANFTFLEDGSVKRATIQEIENQAITRAREKYNIAENRSFEVENGGDRLFVNILEFKKEGLDWLILTAIPESLFLPVVIENMRLTLILAITAILLSLLIYHKVVKSYLKPIESLIETTAQFSHGDFSKRVSIMRNDEIGRISRSFNEMADTLQTLFHSLEVQVKKRTHELEEANNALKESKDQLYLILDSTAEGIYGIDKNGNCIFCNTSSLEMLGYKSHDELIGKNMHWQIHHSHRDGTPMPIEDCKIFKALKTGNGTRADDEVFWKADGTSLAVEYHSYPQFKDGELVGAVVTFLDNTERKRNEDYIKYLSYHDSLTGLYNRMFFEEEMRRLNTERSLPLSIIFGDLNGLKLTNDIFGHAAGDGLLRKTAEILKKVCREEDIIARVGGDEFAILLPKTSTQVAQKIIERIKNEFSKEPIGVIKYCMSMGYDTKVKVGKSIERTLENAEDMMYKEKMLNRKTIDSSMIHTIIETLHNFSEREKQHSINVSELCQNIGRAMKLPDPEIRKLKEAGYLHDIGKIVLDNKILKKKEKLTEEEKKEMQQHPVVGYRILNLFGETLDIAEGVLHHHEGWDGSGYPKGLKSEEIPKLARIIKVAESYDSMVNKHQYHHMSHEEALKEIEAKSGILYDPEIVKIFVQMMKDDQLPPSEKYQ